MYGNENRVEKIRTAVFGIEVRDPIVKCINQTLNVVEGQIDTIEIEHEKRVSEVSTDPISGMPNYYTIGFTRVNHG